MLSDVQLKELAVKMNYPLEEVCFKDELPSKLKYNAGYIINMESELDAEGKPNDGSHWCAFIIQKANDGVVRPIYFDPFGVAPPKDVCSSVEKFCGKKLPYTTSDIQSLQASACGWYSTAFLYWCLAYPGRSGHVYTDTTGFIDCFNNLNESHDHKHNEFILKNFFRSSDPAKRIPINIGDIQEITNF
jgi:hypothetical protein